MKQSDSGEVLPLEINGWRVLLRVRTLAYFLGALGLGSGVATAAQLFGVATTSDVQALQVEVKSAAAHAASIEPVVAEHTQAIKAIVVTQEQLRDFLYTDAAERLADKAADPVRDARRRREVWRSTRERVLDNLRAGRPTRAGLPE